MILSVHQPQYIPWLGFFDKIVKSDTFVYLDTVQYKKREWQNRNQIRTKDGSMWLTVPVVSKGNGGSRQPINQVRIDNESTWASDHLKSIQCWYGKAPFFEKYISFFEETYSKCCEKLIDLNITILDFLFNELNVSTKVMLESDIGTSLQSTDRIIEICQKVNADTYLTGIGGGNYLDESKFERENIKLVYQDYLHPTYQQQFLNESQAFLPNMSIVDLLFNEGEKSSTILKGD